MQGCSETSMTRTHNTSHILIPHRNSQYHRTSTGSITELEVLNCPEIEWPHRQTADVQSVRLTVGLKQLKSSKNRQEISTK